MRLTKEAIEKAKRPSIGRNEYFIRDNVAHGLGVRITASGAKSFIFEARIKGRTRRMTLGTWPDLNLVLARQRVMEIRTRIAVGEDPATKAADARKETTFGGLIALYMERHAKPHKRSAALDEKLLRNYVPAGWHNRRLSDIARADVTHLHTKIGEVHGHCAANRTLALLRTMFNLAITW
jgi:hypothetical protein